MNKKVNFHLLECLPQDILGYCIQYLSFPEIGVLDISLTNHHLRRLYLDAINGLIVPDLKAYDIKSSSNGIDWILSRGVKTKSISFVLLSAKGLALLDNLRDELEELSITKFRDASLWLSSHIGCFQYLASLTFRHSSVSNEDLRNILKSNPNLTKLTLDNITGLTSGCIPSINEFCRQLRYLSLPNNHWLNDEAIYTLSQGVKQLMYLDLEDYNFDSVSDNSIIELLNSFHDLRGFCLQFQCHSVEVSNMVIAKIAYPSLMSFQTEAQVLGITTTTNILKNSFNDYPSSPDSSGSIPEVEDREGEAIDNFRRWGIVPRILEILDKTQNLV